MLGNAKESCDKTEGLDSIIDFEKACQMFCLEDCGNEIKRDIFFGNYEEEFPNKLFINFDKSEEILATGHEINLPRKVRIKRSETAKNYSNTKLISNLMDDYGFDDIKKFLPKRNSIPQEIIKNPKVKLIGGETSDFPIIL